MTETTPALKRLVDSEPHGERPADDLRGDGEPAPDACANVRLTRSPGERGEEQQRDRDVSGLNGVEGGAPEEGGAVTPPVADAENPQARGQHHEQGRRPDELRRRHERQRRQRERDERRIAVRGIGRVPVRDQVGCRQEGLRQVDAQLAPVPERLQHHDVQEEWQGDEPDHRDDAGEARAVASTAAIDRACDGRHVSDDRPIGACA